MKYLIKCILSIFNDKMDECKTIGEVIDYGDMQAIGVCLLTILSLIGGIVVYHIIHLF